MWTRKVQFLFLDLTQSWSGFGEDLFFLRSCNFGRKNRFKSGEDLFLRSIEFDRKTASIWFKTDENLGQVRLLLFPASKKAPSPSLEIPGYAPGRIISGKG